MSRYRSIEEAQEALRLAEADVAGDMGEEAVESCWLDLVAAVAEQSTPAVGRELRRRNT